jgi:molecular chaperone HscB
VACWSCGSALAPGTAFCPSCRKIQPLEARDDHFALLGVPRRYGVDGDELSRRYRDLSRLLHPDRFARAGARERRFSLERSTRLNDAYRTLRDGRRRAEYLLRLAGGEAPEARTLDDPGFLEEQMAIREALASGDEATRRRIAGEERERLARLLAEVTALFADEEAGRGDRRAEIARCLARARYCEAAVAEAGDAPAAP